MEVGMLWYDNTPEWSIEEKIRLAAAYYEAKYGERPTHCEMWLAKDVVAEPFEVDGIQVFPTSCLMPNHFWIGVVGNPEKPISDSVLTVQDARGA